MRTTSSNLTPELQKVLTKSTFLIWFQTTDSTPVDYYLSSEGQLTWNGQVWQAAGCRVRHPVSLDTMAFSMPNHTGAILAMAANGFLWRAPVKVWVLYPDTDPETDGAVLFMRGVVSRVSNLFEDRADFSVDRYADENQIVPTTFIAPPNWNKLPPRNLELRWNSRKIALFRPELEN